MVPRCGRTWSLLVVAVALASLGAVTGGLLALAYRPIGLAYLDVLDRCPPSAAGRATCLADATWAVGVLMISGAAIALGTGLAAMLVAGVLGERRTVRMRPAHPVVQGRFVELCRQHRLVGHDRPRLRIGGRRADSTAGPGRRAVVLLPAWAVRRPLVPVVFDPLVRAELDRIASGQAARRAALRGWPWPLASGCVAVAGAAVFTGHSPGVSAGSTARVLLLAVAVAGLAVGLPVPGATPGARAVAWCAAPAVGVIAGAAGQTGAAVLWHLAPTAGDRLVAGAALVPALLVLAGLLPALTARRGATVGAPGGAAVPAALAALAGVVAGLVAFPVGTAAAPELAAPLLVRPAPTGPVGTSGPAPDDPAIAGPALIDTATIDTATANRAARAVEPALGPAWQADPLPAAPPAGHRPAGCHPSIVGDYLRRAATGRTGHGVARYAARAGADSGGLGWTTLQIDVVSYRPDPVSANRPVDVVFTAVERAGTACRDFADVRSGLRVQSLPRATPAVGDRAWRMDLVRTLGRGAGRVTSTTALGVVQVDATVVVVSMTVSLSVVDAVLFEQAMRRTVAVLVADR